jgi:hypothetical protein
MLIALPGGVPIIDGLWIGAVVVSTDTIVFAVELGTQDEARIADPANWRAFERSDIWLLRGLAFVARTNEDIAHIVRAWHRPCGRIDACACEAVTVPGRPAPVPPRQPVPALPRLPMCGARSRGALAA